MSERDALERIARIDRAHRNGGVASAADRAWLAEYTADLIGRPTAARRRARRDALIRDMRAYLPSAQMISKAISDYGARCWPRDRSAKALPAGYTGLRRLLYLAYREGAKPITSRQIQNILSGLDRKFSGDGDFRSVGRNVES